MGSTYAFPRPALAVDCVVFGFRPRTGSRSSRETTPGPALSEGARAAVDAEQRFAGGLEVLLVERALDPPGWALPGGFVRLGESVDAAARRELAEEAGVEPAYLEQLHTFGEVDRDPRERVVSVAYFALVRRDRHPPQAATDASAARWFEVADVPPLAFDHGRILEVALERLRSKVTWRPVGFELLPDAFTLSELQHLHEVVQGRPLDKRNFRKKVLTLGLLEETGEQTTGGRHRPARLYRFDRAAYERLSREGFELRLG